MHGRRHVLEGSERGGGFNRVYQQGAGGGVP